MGGAVLAGTDPAASRGVPRFGLFEWGFTAIACLTVLANPVVASSGSLELYLNTLTWPVLGLAALVRWARTDDRRLSGAMAALAVATIAAGWLVVLQGLISGFGTYAVPNGLRLTYAVIGIAASLAVYRAISRILDLVLICVGLKCVILLAGLAGGPFDVAHRLTVPEMGGHNIFAAFLAFLVLVRLSMWILAGDGRRPALPVAVSMLLAALSVFATFSRGAVVALLAGLAVLLGLALRRGGGRPVLAGFLVALVALPLALAGPVSHRLRDLGLTSSSGRDQIWQVAWEGFLDQPVAGRGFGSFEVTQSAFESAASLGAPSTYSAHNVLLQILYEGGVVGVVVVAGTVWLLWRRCGSMVILPVAVAVGVQALFDTFALVVQVSWALGVILAVGLATRQEPVPVPADAQPSAALTATRT